MGADSVALVVVAVCGSVTGVFSWLQSRRAGNTASAVQHNVAAPELMISPELHSEYTQRLAERDREVSQLQELLRVAVRLVRRENRRLAAAGLEPEPVPDELIPYSIS